MSIQFIKQGILDTVQDLGRTSFRAFGINANGAMDQTAVRLINILLGNFENEAVLEMHYPAPEILFESDAMFALGGGDFDARLAGDGICPWRLYIAKAGDVLRFSGKISGSRVYLSIRGGFEIEKWLGGTSTNLQIGLGGAGGKKLKKGDRLRFKSYRPAAPAASHIRISPSLIPYYSRFPTVRVVAGPEFELLGEAGREIFLNHDFQLSNRSNRMGYRLEGPPIKLHRKIELVSSAVNFGTVQLLPDGQMIILMADHQTTGGYPRIASISRVDLPLAAQLTAHDKIAFHLISAEEAENLLLKFEKDLMLLKTAMRFR